MSVYKVVEVDSDPHSRREVDVYSAAFAKEAVAATTFFMLVDLDGAGYPHAPGTKVSIVGAFGRAFKTNAGARWAVDVGVVTRIDATDADITYFAGASMFLRDTSQLSVEAQAVILDFPISAEVATGELARGISNFNENPEAGLNTGAGIEDPKGATPTAAVGDVVIRARLISGGGTLDFISSLQYFVES
jgi:hypothetical protein